MDGQTPSSPQQNEAQGTGADEGFFKVEAPAPAEQAAGAAEHGAGGPDGADPAAAANGERRGVFVYEHRDGRQEEFTVRDDLLNQDGTLNALRAAKQATDLRGKLSERGIDPDAAAVQPPDAYTVTVPEDLAALVHVGEPDPENPKPITIGPDDPALAAMTPVFQELGLDQERADKLIGTWLGIQAEQHRQAEEMAAEDDRVSTEMVVEAFGTKDAARQAMAGELGPWLGQMMQGDEQTRQLKYAVLSEAGKTGPLALALWDIYQGVRGQGMAAPPPGTSAPPGLSRADLQEMMRSDAYNTPGHPEFQAVRDKVAQGYRNLKGDA